MSNGDDDSRRRKRIALISFSSIFLVAMVVAVTVGVSLSHDQNKSNDSKNGSKSDDDIYTSSKAIQSICAPTDYKRECVSSLSSVAGNTTDSRELIIAVFKAAMNQINEGAKKSTLLQDLEKDPMAKKALEDCKELMDFAVDELQHSASRFGDLDITKLDDVVIDLRTWLSAVVTYQETCLDGFQNTTGDAGKKMREALTTAMHLSSNGLAIVSGMSSLLADLQIPGFGGSRRRLLRDVVSDNWSNPGVRRLLQVIPTEIEPNIIVAKDGSGKFKTINEAVLEIPKRSNQTFVIYIKEGVYEEYVHINTSMTHVMMIGDGAQKTRITGNQSYIDGTPTFKTSTFAVTGDYFTAKNIGFENSAGAAKHQAVALKVQSDFSTFYNCSMDGYQDTLYVHTKRQFYRDCTISGTIDFVFGDATAIFQNCTFVVRKPMDNQQCIVTAQGRKESLQASGIVLQGCSIVSDPAFFPVRFERRAYLGRPWKAFSRTIIMETHIDDLIQPQGWLPWVGDFALDTCFYAEFQNTGPGANSTGRVNWAGVKKNITREEVLEYTAGRFFLGDEWIKDAQVPYISGMITS
ncbi:putative pectinesterase/pectinesterase inhibitor 28 [Corylus avellana]|uniref:putative pectinesterase/pectinesterase inhibitor 28 n=1 Tax=Corylus avellana TaxID=13451 RepID=UPI00286B8678|nr:putative pectinesterase/pectinesterase inhibitor 28 [Corylus avellana]